MAWIKLHRKIDDGGVYVNTNNIFTVGTSPVRTLEVEDDEHCCIVSNNGDYIRVKESLYEVVDMISQQEKDRLKRMVYLKKEE